MFGGLLLDCGMSSVALEFEHFIGVNPIPRGAQFHPDGQHYVFAAGGNVVLGDITDPHKQEFLRKHDDYVTVVQLSKRGNFIGSGQRGSNSNVVIWSYETREIMFICEENDEVVTAIDFSEDEKIVATLGGNLEIGGNLIFWDMSTGYIIAASGKIPPRTNCLSFNGKVRDIKRRDTEQYLCCTAGKDGVMLWHLDAFIGELIPFRMAGDGRATLTREITALAFSDDKETCYCATTTGDFLVGSMKSQKMVQAIQATKLGLFSILALPSSRGGGVAVGCGDNTIKVFDGKFELKSTAKLDSSILGLGMSSDALEALSISSRGTICRVNLASLDYLTLSEAHTAPVTCISFCLGQNDRFATGSQDGSIRVWDMSEYVVVGTVAPRKESDAGLYKYFPKCISYADIIISGWSDGKIIAYNEEGSYLWQIDAAHPEAVTCLTLSHNRRFLMTGGPQGEVRMWELRTRDLISNLKEHKSKVTCIALTADDSTAITCSRDRCILEWDLRDEKRVFCQMQRMGGINCLAIMPDQKTVVSVGQERNLVYWNRGVLDCAHRISLTGGPVDDEENGDEAYFVALYV